MKILLSGASGFLGKVLHSDLAADSQVYTIGRSGADFICDLSKEVPKMEQEFDLIIHCAGKAHMQPRTAKDVQDFYDVNVTGTTNLLSGIRPNLRPRFIVLISTVSVYGLTYGKNVSEESPLLANDPYGRSKIEAEALVRKWGVENNVQSSILRLPLVAGPNPPGNLGAMIHGIKKGYYFNIAGGSARKSIVLAEDVAKIIPRVAEVGGIFNLTDGYHPSFSEISTLVAAQLGKSEPINIPFWIARLLAKAGDLMSPKVPINSNKLEKITCDLTFDDSKARNELGWNPTHVLEGFRIS